MSLLSRLFGSKGTVDDAVIFTDQLQEHLGRIEAVGEPYTSFIAQYFSPSMVSMLAPIVADKMALTQSNEKEHSFAISKAPVCYQACTLDKSVPEAKAWFGRRYGGYSKVLDHTLSSTTFSGPGCEVLVHIVYSRTQKDTWVDMTILPVGSASFSFLPILPTDLLTEAELPH